jgi:hypothetical protein
MNFFFQSKFSVKKTHSSYLETLIDITWAFGGCDTLDEVNEYREVVQSLSRPVHCKQKCFHLFLERNVSDTVETIRHAQLGKERFNDTLFTTRLSTAPFPQASFQRNGLKLVACHLANLFSWLCCLGTREERSVRDTIGYHSARNFCKSKSCRG